MDEDDDYKYDIMGMGMAVDQMKRMGQKNIPLHINGAMPQGTVKNGKIKF